MRPMRRRYNASHTAFKQALAAGVYRIVHLNRRNNNAFYTNEIT